MNENSIVYNHFSSAKEISAEVQEVYIGSSPPLLLIHRLRSTPFPLIVLQAGE